MACYLLSSPQMLKRSRVLSVATALMLLFVTQAPIPNEVNHGTVANVFVSVV